MKIFLFVAAAITFISMMRGVFTSGPLNNTTIFLAGIALALWGYGYFYDKLKKQKWLTISIFIFIFTVLTFSVFLFFYGSRTTAIFNEDVIIVLGAGIRDGEVGGTLARRLDAAVSYHKQNPNALIIVSGGVGHREVISEAEAMRRYLIYHGVDPSVILLEDRAYSTYSNMRYSRIIIDEHFDDVPNVVVITSGFHMYRSVRFARQVGLDITIYSARTPVMSTPFAYVREVASVIKMWVIGR